MVWYIIKKNTTGLQKCKGTVVLFCIQNTVYQFFFSLVTKFAKMGKSLYIFYLRQLFFGELRIVLYKMIQGIIYAYLIIWYFKRDRENSEKLIIMKITGYTVCHFLLFNLKLMNCVALNTKMNDCKIIQICGVKFPWILGFYFS